MTADSGVEAAWAVNLVPAIADVDGPRRDHARRFVARDHSAWHFAGYASSHTPSDSRPPNASNTTLQPSAIANAWA